MKVVLDTNIILASVSPFSPYHSVFEKFEQGVFTLKKIKFPQLIVKNMEEFIQELKNM